jgi:putative membrane protein
MPQLGGMWMGEDRRTPWWRLLMRWLVLALGVVIAAHTSKGISYTGPDCMGPHGFGTLALVVVVLSFFNLVFKPVLVLFTLPFVVLSLGLGLWFINALLFMLAAKVVPGFVVAGFSSALWGALVVSVVSLVMNRSLLSRRRGVRTRVLGGVSGPPPSARRDDDVIDL